jgi:hypothetical protein
VEGEWEAYGKGAHGEECQGALLYIHYICST